jgi:WD40 repeat protein/DNA-binding SARP family transcriptional activator
MLQIRLLGQFDVRLDGRRVLLPSRSAQSLLAYFAMTAGTAHRREKLAGNFWPESSDETARKNLRHELWRIRKAISSEKAEGNEYLLAEDLTLTFDSRADYWLDVAHFEKSGPDLQSLTAGLSLYQGELLPGFYEEWILLERERLRSVFDNKMEQLLAHLITGERWTAAQEQAERWLTLGSSLEPAYRALMMVYGARGDMAKVSHVYQQCITALDEQLGLEPSAETRALYDGLLKGAKVPSRPMQAHASGTITFLFTDIEGSTKLLDQLGDQYATVLVEHHQIMRSAIQKWNGNEVDTQGDAFFVTFARSLDAVQCAAEVQRTLASHAWLQDQPLRVRMGLHTGEPLIASTGYVGMDVHRAARIGDAAHGGQVLLSRTTRELVMYDLPKGMGIRDLGEHRLKDLKYPTPIYQLIIDGLPQDFPALRTKFTGTEDPAPGLPPFKGLQYFEEADSELFFGRELLTAKLINRLRETQFLSVIIGASGSGKSSLVRAGVIPALRKGQALLDGTKPPDGSQNWHVHILTPTARPVNALAVELTRNFESVTAAATLIDDMMQDPRSLGLFLSRQYPQQHILLVLDQFEELFTLCRDEFEREAFIDNLITTIRQNEGQVTVIITLRADFYAYLAQYPELRDVVAKQQEYIGPMTVEELRRAIEEPARRSHWEFEPGLVDLILRDIGDEPGALPLLSHALLETWKRRAGHTLTLKGYADAGGVRGAIAHTAETLYQSLSADEQVIVRDIFLRLTELGEGTEDTRRRAAFEELTSHTDSPEEVLAVLNALADARLVTLSEDSAEVAHEALIREWPTLREWLNQDREGLRLHRHLTEAAYEWELLGRDPGALYRGAHLAQAREWFNLHPRALNARERTFLDASLEHEEHEQKEHKAQQQRELEAAQRLAETERLSAQRMRVRNRAISIIGMITLLLALLTGVFGFSAQRQRSVAQANYIHADSMRLALEAEKILAQPEGNVETAALLSIRALKRGYISQADATLLRSVPNLYAARIYKKHTDNVNSVAFSPDGKYILTGSKDHTAILWDTMTGEALRSYNGHTDEIRSVAFSSDGHYILTGSGDRTAKLWETSNGAEIVSFEMSNPVIHVSFSSNGKDILVCDINGKAKIWNISTSKMVPYDLANQDGWAILDVALSPDGRYILTASFNRTAVLWDIATGTRVHTFVQDGPIYSVAFSADGKYVLTGSGDFTAKLWDVGSGQEIRTFITGANVLRVAFSPNEQYVLTGGDANSATLWDLDTGTKVRSFTGHAEMIEAVAFSPSGQHILTGSDDDTARLWNISLSPQAAAESGVQIFRDTATVGSATFSPDDRSILAKNRNFESKIWDISSGQVVQTFKGHSDRILRTVFSPDGRHMLSGGYDGTIRMWDVAKGEEVYKWISPVPAVSDVTFSPNGKYILTGGEAFEDQEGGQFRVSAVLWNLSSTTPIRLFTLENSIGGIWSVAFSPDGKYVATAGSARNNAAILWNADTATEIRSFGGHTGGVNQLTFSPDGKYILTGSDDGTAKLWDVATGQEIHTFSGHTNNVLSVAFSPDGKYVLTGSRDRTAKLWETATGDEKRTFIMDGQVSSVAFSHDGNWILLGTGQTVDMIAFDYQTPLNWACSQLLRDFTPAERSQYNIKDTSLTCSKP